MGIDKLKGTGVALVTPFNEDMSIDFNGLNRVLDHVVDGKVDYLVVLGSTGEAATLTWDEKLKVLDFIIKKNTNKLPIVFGLGGNNTMALVDQLKSIEKYPIDAILSASPHYNKPSQKGIKAHYSMLADESSFPVILYNVPSRTASNVAAETTIELSKHPNIIGIKEASGDLHQCGKIISSTSDDFLMISGDDGLTLPILALGGDGVISVIANLLPHEFAKMVNDSLAGDFKKSSKTHGKLIPFYELLSKEGNPVSLKTGMEASGIIDRYVRLPLVAGSNELLADFKNKA